MPEDTEDIIPDALSDEAGVTSPDGDGTDSAPISVKDVINKTLGKDFQDDETALKAVKDTFSHVGKFGKYQEVISKLEEKSGGEGKALESLKGMLETDTAEMEIDTKKFVSKEQYEQDMFYSKHSEYQPYKDVLSGLAQSKGISLDEATKDDSFKTMFDKTQAYDKAEDSKSVLMSNKKIGLATDKMSEAKKEISEGKTQQGEAKAADAVIEAFDIG